RAKAVLENNQRILENDQTRHRNLTRTFRNSLPLISIVIPTSGRPEFLKQALLSCSRQTFENFEVIVVENGGDHGAKKIVSGLKDDRFRYFFTPRSGASTARNIGNRYSRGKYIVIMDDDDVMVSTRLEDHLR